MVSGTPILWRRRLRFSDRHVRVARLTYTRKARKGDENEKKKKRERSHTLYASVYFTCTYYYILCCAGGTKGAAAARVRQCEKINNDGGGRRVLGSSPLTSEFYRPARARGVRTSVMIISFSTRSRRQKRKRENRILMEHNNEARARQTQCPHVMHTGARHK